MATDATRSASHLEHALLHQLRQAGVPDPVLEHAFHARRKWRFDLAWPDMLIAVECQGGGQHGRHGRYAGHQADCEKLSHAAIAGWRVLHCNARQVASGQAARWIAEAIENCAGATRGGGTTIESVL